MQHGWYGGYHPHHGQAGGGGAGGGAEDKKQALLHCSARDEVDGCVNHALAELLKRAVEKCDPEVCFGMALMMAHGVRVRLRAACPRDQSRTRVFRPPSPSSCSWRTRRSR
jgi:hypothetical protein